MSLQERELLIEYIRTVRDHQVLLERIAKHIDNANLRITDILRLYLNGDNIDTNSTNRTATTSRHNRILSRNPVITINPLRRPLVPPPPPPPQTSPPRTPSPPSPPAPSPPAPSPPAPSPPAPSPPSSITSRTSRDADESSVATIFNTPETTRNDTLTPLRSTTTRDLSTSTRTPITTTLPGTPDDPTLIRVRRWVNQRITPTTNNINIPRLDSPPGLHRTTTRRRNSTTTRYRVPMHRVRPPYALDIPSEEATPRDIGSPVRVRPNVTQIRIATELLKWEDVSGNYQETCPISMITFDTGDDIMRIKSCQHIFREMNLRQWFRYSPRCPICRYDIRDYSE